MLIQTKSGVFDTVGHVCPAHTGSECTRCTYAHTHTHFPVQLLVTQVGFRCSAAPLPTCSCPKHCACLPTAAPHHTYASRRASARALGQNLNVRSVARRNAWGAQDDRNRTADFSGGATASCGDWILLRPSCHPPCSSFRHPSSYLCSHSPRGRCRPSLRPWHLRSCSWPEKPCAHSHSHSLRPAAIVLK